VHRKLHQPLFCLDDISSKTESISKKEQVAKKKGSKGKYFHWLLSILVIFVIYRGVKKIYKNTGDG